MQPRYGFTLKRKPRSGLSFLERIVCDASSSRVTAARGGALSSSVCEYSTVKEEKGLGGLESSRGFMPRTLTTQMFSVKTFGEDSGDARSQAGAEAGAARGARPRCSSTMWC